MWIKLDDKIAHHPKFLAAGPDASWLWICGQAYCAGYLTDGFIPEAALPSLGSIRNPARQAAKLVDVGLWHRVADGFQVHDYAEYQPTREEAESRREKRAEAGRRGGIRSGESRRGERSVSGAPTEQSAAPVLPGNGANASHSDEAEANPVPVLVDPPNPPSGDDLATAYGLSTEPVLANRTAAFFGRWRELYVKCCQGASYRTIGPNSRRIPPLMARGTDFRACLELCHRYDDDRLDAIAEVFLRTDGGTIGRADKTLGWLSHHASAIDAALARRGVA